MTTLKRLALAFGLALMLAVSAMAGETNTPPSAAPCSTDPGETNTPPCSSSVTVSDDGTSTPIDRFAVETAVWVIEDMVSIF